MKPADVVARIKSISDSIKSFASRVDAYADAKKPTGKDVVPWKPQGFRPTGSSGAEREEYERRGAEGIVGRYTTSSYERAEKLASDLNPKTDAPKATSKALTVQSAAQAVEKAEKAKRQAAKQLATAAHQAQKAIAKAVGKQDPAEDLSPVVAHAREQVRRTQAMIIQAERENVAKEKSIASGLRKQVKASQVACRKAAEDSKKYWKKVTGENRKEVEKYRSRVDEVTATVDALNDRMDAFRRRRAGG